MTGEHEDAHAHAHEHGVAHHHEPAPRGGPVVIDIGGDNGALIVRLDDRLEGTEIPIEFADDPTRDIHTGVWRRALGAGSVVVAVFPQLRRGSYRLHACDGHDGAQLQITGGHVTELDLRSAMARTA
ncbi:MAG: hypothetical protein JWN99_367 [Ilumatobacteraceae bacterium]|nr:hypothetical protein [Ilumatobacteraceae bacterium]